MKEENVLKDAPTDDGRALDHRTLEEIRIRSVKAVLRGYSPEVVIGVLGLSRCCIYVWLDAYHKGGWEALRARPLAGRPAELDEQAKAWLKEKVLQTTPEDWGYETVLWTRGILAELIRQHFEIEVSETTVGRYLHELGLSAQVPDWKAHEQNPEKVNHWLGQTFPQIVSLAKKIGADLYFLDESGCRAHQHSGRTWGLVGKRPVIKSTGQRFGLNMISAISPEGELRFKVLEQSIGSAEFITFLKGLLKQSDHPIIVILDRNRIHLSEAVRQFARPRRQRLKIFTFPTYSPECNPDEGVWSDVKPHGISRQAIHGKTDFKAKLYRVLHSLQKQPSKVISCFLRSPACMWMSIVMVTSGYL